MEIIYIRAYFVKHTISGWIDTFWHHEGFFTFDVSFHLFIFSFIRRSKKLATRAINVHTAPEHKHRFSIRDACKDFIISLGNCALLKHLCCFFMFCKSFACCILLTLWIKYSQKPHKSVFADSVTSALDVRMCKHFGLFCAQYCAKTLQTAFKRQLAKQFST